MDILQVVNPISTAEILQESFISMNPVEFQKTLQKAILHADEFCQADDSNYSSRLSGDEAVMYACHIRTFIEALAELKDAQRIPQRFASYYLAKCLAFKRVLDTFRDLHVQGVKTEEDELKP